MEENFEILRREAEILKKIVEWEERNKENLEKYEHYGFKWYEVNVSPQKLNRLVTLGILKICYKSRSSTEYRLINRELVKEVLRTLEEAKANNQEENLEIPEDLFDCIIGYEDLKELLTKTLKRRIRVHFLLVGSPATAKSMFLEELERVGGRYYLGSSTSKAGLIDMLAEDKPRVLLIDEIDKMKREDMAALLSVMESGKLVECKSKKERYVSLQTIVVAAANDISKIPKELVSRFAVFRFRPYSKEEFVRVCEGILTKREGIDKELARYIAEKVWEYRKDVREAIRVARLANSKEEAKKVISIFRKHFE